MSLEHLAKQLAAHGRGKDTELVHMDKGELASLQQIAQAHGGDLSINPKTGLPEAGFLSSILPTVAGVAVGAMTGNPMLGAAVGAGLGGLMNPQHRIMGALSGGLGGYSGAGLGVGAADVAATEAAQQAVASGSEAIQQQALQAANAAAQEQAPGALYQSIADLNASGDAAAQQAYQQAVQQGTSNAYQSALTNAKELGGVPSLANFGSAASNLSGKQMLGMAVPFVSGMLNQQQQAYSPPGTAAPMYYNTAYLGAGKGFAPGVYESFYRPQGLPGYADGGTVAQPYTEGLGANPYAQQASAMDPGKLQFTIDNASSPLMQTAAQHEMFNRKSRQRTPVQRMATGGIANAYAAGGKFLRGPGDGVSDSIPAVIHGENPQRAALADGEFVLPARIVSEIGNGSSEAGARKLYAMMDRIQKRRQHTVKDVAKDTKAEKLLPA
jgi:hypothetical protein